MLMSYKFGSSKRLTSSSMRIGENLAGIGKWPDRPGAYQYQNVAASASPLYHYLVPDKDLLLRNL